MVIVMGDWTEKYRPKSLDEVLGNERAILELRKWAGSWSHGLPKKRAVILSGRPGIGKTSCAYALAYDYNWTTIELNTSDARNAEKIKKVATYGAQNETFSDDGSFLSYKQGRRKLIILDEADNLYEKSDGSSSSDTNYSDKGGKKAIIDTIKTTSQPIILIVNDYYGLTKGSGESLKNICKLIKFYDPYPSVIFNLLKKISVKEGINADKQVLQLIADRCKGDIRSAVNDLQSLSLNRNQIDAKSLDVIGYRDREKDIFNALREVFKTKNIKLIRESTSNLDVDPKMLLLWINENLPNEYREINDLIAGYKAISKADIFIGRTDRSQNYALWSYACDLMNGGVATAKTRTYPNDRYNFPKWLRERKDIKYSLEIKETILSKLGKLSHSSNKKGKENLFPYFSHMFKNNTIFAIKMKKKLDLSEQEISYLLGNAHKHKLQEIINSNEPKLEKAISEKVYEGNKKEEKENIQHSLLDF